MNIKIDTTEFKTCTYDQKRRLQRNKDLLMERAVYIKSINRRFVELSNDDWLKLSTYERKYILLNDTKMQNALQLLRDNKKERATLEEKIRGAKKYIKHLSRIRGTQIKNLTVSQKLKPSKKFVGFIKSNGKPYSKKEALIKGSLFSGMLDDVVLKLTLFDDGSVSLVDDSNSQLISERMLNDFIEEIFTSEKKSVSLSIYDSYKHVSKKFTFYNESGETILLEFENSNFTNKFHSIFGEEDEEIRTKKGIQLSNKSLDLIGSILSDLDEDSDEDSGKDVGENLVDVSHHAAPLKIAQDDSLNDSWLDNSFKKMSEDKLNELKERLSKLEEELGKNKFILSSTEKNTRIQKNEINLLKSRIDSLSSNLPPNGILFFVDSADSEKNKLSESEMKILEKISKRTGLELLTLEKVMTEPFFRIKVTEKSKIESPGESDFKDLAKNLSNLFSTDKIVSVSKNEYVLYTDFTWHDVVGKMIKSGFEQSPEWDELCLPLSSLTKESSL